MSPSTSLSVIIPFYNETAFLTTAVNSVLSQGIGSVEVIIVNDNPDTFPQAFFDGLGFPENVQVTHHARNRGLPSSRNTGIDVAQGAHIAFLDADDYYLPQGLRKHLEYAQRQGAEITHAQTVITHVNRVSGDVIGPDSAYLGPEKRGRYDGADVIEAGFFIESSWASIYTADFLKGKNVRFDESQVKFEDRIFVIEALLAADSLAILGEPCRVWRKRNNSITTSAKSYEDQLLKLNLVRKSVDLWLNKCSQHGRHRAMCEFVRQTGYMITKNESSPWYGTFGFSGDEGDQKLTEMLSEYFFGLQVNEPDVVAAFDAKSPKYSGGETGGGRISPHDMFRFIDAVARRDYETARGIVNLTVRRPRPFALPHLPKPTGGGVRILLHAGLHKTGTTHIQYQLAHNRKALQANGILFPQTGFGFVEGKEPVRAGGLPGHQALVTSVFQSGGALIERLKGEILGAQCHTVVISAENLSQPDAPYAARARRMRQVVEALSEIGAVTPVFMYRQPDAWLESYYREISGNGAPLAYQTPGEFLVNNMILLDFGAIVGAAEEACGNQAVLFSFEEALQGYDDLTLAFLDKCGLVVPPQQISLTEDTRYPSTCDAQLEIARITSLLVQDQSVRQNILRTFYTQVENSGQKHKLFTPRERRQIVNTFCDRAAALFAKRGISDPRDGWLERIKDGGAPPEVMIPGSYLDVLRIAGVMSGTGIMSAAPVIGEAPARQRPDHVTEISLHDLDRIAHETRAARDMAGELDYMRNSVSWRVTTPLRTVMRGYKKLRGIA
ncbi:glycosyltransferase family 2 protein (plasmid) [Leisingera caerulea]|uniref:Glycosyltransferase family 2 protein n=1 Tax=Leisingera caerulea TaxID=506591 RepID=A0ABY5X3F7_LEICA|nr:glycosyltransferase family 2 protein [Leisingera caerulea]UWQ61059.1 glycosyltransferase family 2 protein [Leisingera caerulea]UWQ64740.1 glycosyltransferase family 2 protein [Leisingera caerulea]